MIRKSRFYDNISRNDRYADHYIVELILYW
jgi:hypothetical protein